MQMSRRCVDEACIWSTIETYEPSESILCLDHFENAPKREDHECHGHLNGYLLPDVFSEEVYPEFEARTHYTLRQPEMIDALF